MELADTLKALADPNRLRILHLLDGRTLCVCDLEAVLGLEQSNLSRHLAKLRQAGLVVASKRGQFVHYARPPLAEPYGPPLDELLRRMSADPAWAADRTALAARHGGCLPA